MAEETKEVKTAPVKEYAPTQEEKTMGLLAYIGPLFLIPLLGKKDSQFAQFHAKQGLVLFGLDVILWLIGWIITAIFFSSIWSILYFGWLTSLITFAIWIVIAIFSIMGVYQAAVGKWWKLPLGLDKIAASLKF